MKDTLTRFVKQECANFDRHHQTCIEGMPCKVLGGEWCGYFEKAVLGPPDYKFRLPNWNYAKLFGEYDDLTGRSSEVVTQRLCTCGENVKLRQRFCADCSEERRKTTNRKYNRKRAG